MASPPLVRLGVQTRIGVAVPVFSEALKIVADDTKGSQTVHGLEAGGRQAGFEELLCRKVNDKS